MTSMDKNANTVTTNNTELRFYKRSLNLFDRHILLLWKTNIFQNLKLHRSHLLIGKKYCVSSEHFMYSKNYNIFVFQGGWEFQIWNIQYWLLTTLNTNCNTHNFSSCSFWFSVVFITYSKCLVDVRFFRCPIKVFFKKFFHHFG